MITIESAIRRCIQVSVAGSVLIVLGDPIASQSSSGWEVQEARLPLPALAVIIGEPVISDYGPHVAAIVPGRPGKVHVWCDGATGLEHDGVSSASLRFSPGDGRLAYVAGDGNARVVVVGDVPGPPVDGVKHPGVFFSANGSRFAYLAAKDGREFVVVDGEVGLKHDTVAEAVFSPDGQRVAYLARDGETWSVVVDGRTGLEYDGVGWARFSPDSRRLGYVGLKNEELYFVVDDEETATDYENIASLVFSADGSRFGFMFVAEQDGPSRVFVDGKAGAAYDYIATGTPIFSPNGEHLAYAAEIEGKWRVVIDGKEGDAYDSIGARGIVFSPDSRHVAYMAADGDRRTVVLDGVPSLGYDGILEGTPVFGADGRFVYGALLGSKWRLVSDEAVLEYDDIGANSMKFSSGGRHLAYAARIGEEWRVIVDGQPGPPYDMILSNGPTFRKNGELEYLATKGEDLFRVTYLPAAP